MSEPSAWPPGGLPAGLVYAWWRGDALPALAPLPGFAASATDDTALLAKLAVLHLDEVLARISSGSAPYLARMDAVPVAYGWSASRVGEIGEIGLRFELPAGNHYLWDLSLIHISEPTSGLEPLTPFLPRTCSTC